MNSDTEVVLDQIESEDQSMEYLIQGVHDHGVPCAVCVATRPTVLMIPAKASCPLSWTREYYGYLMADHHSHRCTMFECVDADQESLPGSERFGVGAVFYHIAADCSTSLPSPSYNSHQELNCVLCTK